MAKVFDNQGGAGDGQWETGANWEPVDVPLDEAEIQISADCTVSTDYFQEGVDERTFADLTVDPTKKLTVANGGEIQFDTNPADIDGVLHLDTGGLIRFTNVQVNMSGTIEFDGGTLEMVETDNNTHNLQLDTAAASISTTSNGGTLNLNATNLAKVVLDVQAANCVIHGHSTGTRLTINGGVGAKRGKVFLDEDAKGISLKYVDMIDMFGLEIQEAMSGGIMEGCLLHGSASNLFDNIWAYETALTMRDCFLYYIKNGLRTMSVDCRWNNVVFGENEAREAKANGVDIDVLEETFTGTAHNCLFADPTIGTHTWFDFHSTGHGEDMEAWKSWVGHEGHTVESEFTVVHDSSRQAIKLVTNASTTAAEEDRCDYVLAAWPATHGDTLDVTVYVRGQDGDKIKVIVDPEGHYGTSQETEHEQEASDEWEQVTVATYTANTNADEKYRIPIIIRSEEAGKTYYIDTLAVNGTAVTFDFGAYDGRPAQDVASGGGLLMANKRGNKQ